MTSKREARTPRQRTLAKTQALFFYYRILARLPEEVKGKKEKKRIFFAALL